MADAVLVVELALGDRIVHVDCREQKLAVAEELVEAVNTGSGLFGDAEDFFGDLGEATRLGLQRILEQIEDDRPLVAV